MYAYARNARRLLLGTSVALTAIFSPLASVNVPAQTAGRQFYASPSGSSGNDGSITRPLDLTTALSSASPARAGDTIWLRGGTYLGNFTSSLSGTSSAPIVVRQYPGERATIDSNTSNRSQPALTVNGSDTWYWGFEVTDSNPQRVNSAGYQNPIIRMTSIDVFGARTKFINLVVHDGLQGFGFWATAVDAEIYGSIVYNVGVEAPDRGHGHSIYTQNGTGTKHITDNILFNGFSFGIHAYTEGGQIDNFDIQGNTVFNHGILSAVSGAKSDLLLGGGQVAHNAQIQHNFFYNSPNQGGRGLELGYSTACSTPSVFNNYISIASGSPINLNCTGTAMLGNTFYGPVASSVKSAFLNNTYLTSRPTGTVTFVRPNRYEAGRGNVTVYNWDLLSQVTVDLSPLGLTNGDQFEIRDAENFFAAPVVRGTYSGGGVTIPMTGLTVAQPVGNAPVRPAHTGPEFGAFVVLRSSGGSSSLPVASLTAQPTSILAGQSTNLSWSSTNATSVTIDHGIGSVAASGSVMVSPSATTTYALTAQNGSGSVTRTATVTVTPGGTPGTVTFVRTDSTVRGAWKGTFGSEGYSLATDSTSLPSSVGVTLNGESTWQWSATTTDARALQRAASTSRFAGTWFSAGTFNIDVNVRDGRTHQLALYTVDWDGLGRAETIDVLDAVSGARLDTRSVTNFNNGLYWIWQIAGHVTVRITRTAGANAVVSGLFLDPAGAPTNTPPSISLAASGSAFTAPANVGLTATATDPNGSIAKVEFFSNGALVGTVSSAPYTLALTSLAAGSYSFTARATDNLGASTTSSSVAVTVTASGGGGGGATSAAFLRSDATTQGTWKGVYGKEGSTLALDVASLPSSASVVLAGQSSWLWSGTSSDVRALQRTSQAQRFAGTWYAANSFTIDVNLAGSANHQLALYALDWTQDGRSQRVEVLNAATGAVLDTQTISSFAQGRYLVWKVTGHVIVRVTRLAGPNAVVSGVFLDPLP